MGRSFLQNRVLELAVLSHKDLLCSFGEDQLIFRTGMATKNWSQIICGKQTDIIFFPVLCSHSVFEGSRPCGHSYGHSAHPALSSAVTLKSRPIQGNGMAHYVQG